MSLYKGDSEALEDLESSKYWAAVGNRQTWDPAAGRYTFDDVCATIMFKIKIDSHEDDNECYCHWYPGYVSRHRWTALDEKEWLTTGFVRRRSAIVARHQEYSTGYQKNNLIK